MKISQLTPEVMENLYYCKTTDEMEIKAFIGLVYFRALMKLNHMDVRFLFQYDIGPPLFGATMGVNRFKFLAANVSFDDNNSRKRRWITDRFGAFREIFEEFNDACVIP